MKMIFVEPIGGLCNRMRAIHSAYSIAQQKKQMLTIVWRENAELNCDIKRLFQFPEDIRVISVKNNCFTRIYSKLKYRMTVQHMEDKDIIQLRDSQNVIALDQFDFSKDIYFKTGQQFYYYFNWKMFKPVSKIQHITEMITKKYNEKMIGVHIRRTDNIQAIEVSGMDGFYRAIDLELLKNPSMKFFLATDDVAVEEEMIKRYSNSIICQENKELDRNKAEAIENAWIDVLCLASTQKILGSFYSSFSEVSAMLGDIELEIISCDGEC